ncbi:MAG TPA: hypothetical protein VIT19_08545 [Pyrinomonadaceae bacterium]
MPALIKKIELLANIAIILVAILLGVALVRSFLIRPPATQPTRPGLSIAPGTKLSLTGVDWNGNGKTLILALSTNCRFCTESAPFYQRVVAERTKTGSPRLIAVFPQPVAEGQTYLKELGVAVDEVKQVRLDSLGVAGTPMLIMADSQGAVVETWGGKLPGEKETELLNRIK